MPRLIIRPDRVRVYTNTRRLTIDRVQAETGADIVINGTFYNSAFRPVGNLKADGVVLSREYEACPGYGWDVGTLEPSDDMDAYANFITGTALIRDGQAITPLEYPSELSGNRGRTALGVREDGNIVAFCSGDSTTAAMTLSKLQEVMLAEKCVSGLALDGGASSQLRYRDINIIKTSRVVHNYICIFGQPVYNSVQVGANVIKDYAENLESELKSLGYSTYLVEK